MSEPWLEQNPPRRRQWSTRPIPDRSVVVVHTSEGSFKGGISWIRTRTTAGSYHTIADPATGEIRQLIDYRHAAFGARNFNARTVHVALAMKAAHWAMYGPQERARRADIAGRLFAHAAEGLQQMGLPAPRPVLLTRNEVLQPDASGFVSHAALDPGRRSDPGKGFPWNEAFNAYIQHIGHDTKELAVSRDEVKNIQRLLNAALPHKTPLVVDGIWGPKTRAAFAQVAVPATQVDPDAIRDIGTRLKTIVTELEELAS